jgi:hypothetical protein
LSGSRAGAGWTADIEDLRWWVPGEDEHPGAVACSHQVPT